MSMLLENNILDRFAQPNVIVGLVLVVVGILLALLAKRITRLFRRTNKIEPNDRIMLSIKAFALAVILAALIVIVIS